MKATSTSIHRGAIVMTDKLRELIQLHEGQEVLIEINKLPLKRSLLQNKYFHGVIVPKFQEVFNFEEPTSKEGAKIKLKEKLLPIEVKIDGKIKRTHRDTSDLTTKEFSEFIEHCRALYEYEMGEEIPKPQGDL